MVRIEATCSLESFRKFIIFSTCRSFIPESYFQDFEVFPEREQGPGAIYIEAADKVTLKKIREITFVNAKEILGIIYSSKSGNTQLRWRQTRRKSGKVNGDASPNALVNLVESGVITQDWVEDYLRYSRAPNMENKKVEKSLREDSPNASQESKKDESFLLENKNERIS
ncbi:MAG TPA: hypothetical protein VH415_00755 [Nitrososphaeraceae archaeon]